MKMTSYCMMCKFEGLVAGDGSIRQSVIRSSRERTCLNIFPKHGGYYWVNTVTQCIVLSHNASLINPKAEESS